MTDTKATVEYFQVLSNKDYTVREGQGNAGTSDSTPGLTVRVELSDREKVAGSLFATQDLDAAKQFAIDYMTQRRLVLSDAVLAIRQTRLHNLMAGTVPGITKAGFMTKTDESVAATKARSADIAKQREADEAQEAKAAKAAATKAAKAAATKAAKDKKPPAAKSQRKAS